jgi:hypothetical protein
MRSSGLREAVASGNMFSAAKLFKAEADATMGPNMGLILAACKDVDGIVCSINVLTECLAVGQKYQRPVILAPLLPYSPSGELPLAQLFPQPAKYAFLNKLSYDLSGTMLWAVMGPVYNKFRTQTLQIGPQAAYELQGVPQVTGFGPELVPRPSDWGPHIRMTGFWSLPPGVAGEEDPAVSTALRSPKLASLAHAAAKWEPAKRPIILALESTPAPDAVGLLRAFYEACTLVGVSGIILTTEADFTVPRDSPRLSDLPDLVFELGSSSGSSSSLSSKRGEAAAAAAAGGGRAGGSSSSSAAGSNAGPEGFPRLIVASECSHSWLFPCASVIVHSGAGGVCQAAMAAGVPSCAFPAVGSEHFWAARISALGTGPAVYFEMREIVERLTECIKVARAPSIRASAAALARRLAEAGNGCALAVAAIRAVLARPQHRHCGVVCSWEPDESRASCSLCSTPFTLLNRRRHCRSCGRLACAACFKQRCHLPGFPEDAPQITCERCLDHRRAYFAMHVGETPLPDLPPGVQLGEPGFGPQGRSGAGAGAGAGSSQQQQQLQAASASASSAASSNLRSPGAPAASAAAVVSPDFGAVDLRPSGFGSPGLGLAPDFSLPQEYGSSSSSSSSRAVDHLGKGFAALGLAPSPAVPAKAATPAASEQPMF